MTTKPASNEIEATRSVGLISNYQVEFGCFVERLPGNKRRIRYEVRINGFPSSASFYVEGDRTNLALSDAEVEAASTYIQKFLREGITDGIELVLLEAHQSTHAGGETAFLKDFFRYMKQSSSLRLESDIVKRKRRDWQKLEATAKVRRDTAFFKQYRAQYKTLYEAFARKRHRHSHSEFIKRIWGEHERTTYPDSSSEYLQLALRVAEAPRGGLTARQAALERLSNEFRIAPATIERHYIYKRKKKPAKSR